MDISATQNGVLPYEIAGNNFLKLLGNYIPLPQRRVPV
jgi:hypothetical protein